MFWTVRFFVFDIAETDINIVTTAKNMTEAVIKAKRLFRKQYGLGYKFIQVKQWR